MSRFRPSLVALVGVLLLALSACAGSEPEGSTGAAATNGDGATADDGLEVATPTDGAPPRVVVTTAILGDIVSQVLAGTGAEVEVVMPSGVDPHAYEPSASDGLALREADLVVANGLQLEASLLDVLAAAELDGVVVLAVGEELDDLMEPGEDGHDHDHGDDEDQRDDEGQGDEDHGSFDPHVWLDPLNVGDMAETIAAAYGEIDPGAADGVEQNAADLVAEMAALDVELQDLVATLDQDQRQIVSNHEALGYLAAHFQLEVIATVLPGTSTDVDATAAGFTELVETIRAADVPAIFADTSSSDRLAQALAEEVGDIEVVELYTEALGEPGSGADTVSGMIRTNIERIVEALG